MKKISINRLSHLFLFGLLFFIVILIILGPPTSGDDHRRIVITDMDVMQLQVGFMRTWQREPTLTELRAKLQNFIREEVLYREALSRGYDKDDMVIRRTLMRKMEFQAEGQVDEKGITDEEIQAYLAIRPEKYRVPPSLSFAQIYFNRDKRGSETEQDVKTVISRLDQQEFDFRQLQQFGDRFMLQNHYVSQSPQEIRAQFGEEFAAQVFQLSPDQWQGPVPSGYGLHAVYVYDLEESYLPEWDQIKDRILADMLLEERNAAKEQYYTEILRQYQLVYRGSVPDILRGGEGN